jgi:CheY-like chemotaxis protein
VRRLAEMHGGTLSASSEGVGKGTTFTLNLPLLEGRVAVVTPPPVHGPLHGAEAHALNIVVIEDSDDIADTLAAWLESMGHQVAVARSGRSGLQLVEKTRPNLVLCDLGLPEMDGLEVCKQVRKLDLDAQPMMVALTGWGREEDRRRTREAGFDEHLVKPVAADKLKNVLRRVPS